MNKEFEEWWKESLPKQWARPRDMAEDAFEAGAKSSNNKAIQIARDVFRAYQAHHEYKGEEMLAAVNRNYAEQMEKALQEEEKL